VSSESEDEDPILGGSPGNKLDFCSNDQILTKGRQRSPK